MTVFPIFHLTLISIKIGEKFVIQENEVIYLCINDISWNNYLLKYRLYIFLKYRFLTSCLPLTKAVSISITQIT